MQEEDIEFGLADEQDEKGSEEPPTPVDGDAEPLLSDDQEEVNEPSTATKKSKKKKKKARAAAFHLEPTEPEVLVDEIVKPMQDLKVEADENDKEADEGEDDDQKEGDKPTLTKRDKRRAKEAAKKAREAEAASAPQICNVCFESFESRTKLFAHVEEFGHQLAAPEKGASTQNKKNNAKKGKSKGKR